MQTDAKDTGVYNGKGMVFNIQRWSLQDGPGMRTTVFLKGCPLRCGWCANPESLNSDPEIMTRDVLCIACGKCADVCPNRAIIIEVLSQEAAHRLQEDGYQLPPHRMSTTGNAEGKTLDSSGKSEAVFLKKQHPLNIDWTRCDNCLKCAEVCPAKAIVVSGELKTVGQVMTTVMRDSSFYHRSKGGMTISGGEPMMQWQFTLDLLKAARERGIHTALDTTGFGKWEILEQLLEYSNLVLYDVKHLDSSKHKEATGVGNELILDNLHKTVRKVTVWVRRVVIPGYNDSQKDAKDLARFVATIIPPPTKISLLPYHKFGETKYMSLGKVCQYASVDPIPEERINELKEIIESCCDVKVDIGR